MKIEQALYGESRAGHDLIAASCSTAFVVELVGRMDLPDTAPMGVEWSPVLSGFAYKGQFVIARTFADPAASRRGMALTHALFASLDEVSALDDLRPLLALLIVAPDRTAVMTSREIVDSDDASAIVSDATGTSELAAAAHAMTMSGKGPVVRLGTVGFDELVLALWRQLWPSVRAKFSFRLSFGPRDLHETPGPFLVCTPQSLVPGWHGYRTIGASAPDKLSAAAQLLAGEAGGAALWEFGQDIGASLLEITDLQLLERARGLASEPSPSFSQALAALRLVERLAPNPTSGVTAKRKLVHSLVARLPSITLAEVLQLRNLDIHAVRGERVVSAGLLAWVAANSFAHIDDLAWMDILEKTITGDAAQAWWRKAIINGMEQACHSTSVPRPAHLAFWRWAEINPVVLEQVFDHFQGEVDSGESLARAVPEQLSQRAGEVVMAIALGKDRQWSHLHGAAAGASLPPREAIRRQLVVNFGPSDMLGVQAALRRASLVQILEAAVETGIPLLVTIAGERISREPRLMKSVDIRPLEVQEAWAVGLELNASAWQGPANPRQTFERVLDALLDGEPVSLSLLHHLAVSPLADLCDYPRRAEVWAKVSGNARDELLRTTAIGWVDRSLPAVADPAAKTPAFLPDRGLERAILDSNALDKSLLAHLKTGARAVIQVISALSGYDESRFLQLLYEFTRIRAEVSPQDAESIGRLINTRHWKKAAESIGDEVGNGRGDLWPALDRCGSMLQIGTLFKLSLFAPRPPKLDWLSATSFATHLKPKGPDKTTLQQHLNHVPQAMTAAETPHIFISYTHDNAGHKDLVLQLSERLRSDGYDAQIDRYVNGSPPEGWPRWMLNQLDLATHILLVCTPTYYRRFRGHEDPNKGLGADWEGALITQELYDQRSVHRRFIPVLFDSMSVSSIPEPLRAQTHYRLDNGSGYDQLLDAINGVSGVEPAPLGVRAPRKRRPATARASKIADGNANFGGQDGG